MLDHKEIRTLVKIHRWLVEDIIEAVVTLVLYGVYLLLFVITSNIFLEQDHPRPCRLRWVVLAASVISFIFATLNAAGQTLFLVSDIRSFFLDYIDLPLKKDLKFTDRATEKLSSMSNWVAYLNQIHTDIIIVWRAWVLFPQQRWLMAGPIILLLALIGSSIVYFALDYGSFALAVAVQNSNTDIIERWIIVRYALSIGTNVSTTMLIAYKFWTHRKTLKCVQESRVLHALYLMFESGVLYVLLQIVYVVISQAYLANTDAINLTTSFFDAAYFSILPMYPAIVVALVSSQRSMVDSYNISPVDPRRSHVTSPKEISDSDSAITTYSLNDGYRPSLQKSW